MYSTFVRSIVISCTPSRYSCISFHRAGEPAVSSRPFGQTVNFFPCFSKDVADMLFLPSISVFPFLYPILCVFLQMTECYHIPEKTTRIILHFSGSFSDGKNAAVSNRPDRRHETAERCLVYSGRGYHALLIPVTFLQRMYCWQQLQAYCPSSRRL